MCAYPFSSRHRVLFFFFSPSFFSPNCIVLFRVSALYLLKQLLREKQGAGKLLVLRTWTAGCAGAAEWVMSGSFIVFVVVCVCVRSPIALVTELSPSLSLSLCRSLRHTISSSQTPSQNNLRLSNVSAQLCRPSFFFSFFFLLLGTAATYRLDHRVLARLVSSFSLSSLSHSA